jgi:hypothetical protein
VANDVCVDVFAKMEVNSKSLWVGVWIIVGHERYACGAGEVYGDRCRRLREVRGVGKCGSVRTGREGASEDDATCMDRAKTWVQAEDGVKLSDDIFAESDEFLVRW